MYTPYFYIIQHTITKIYYAGVRYAKDSNPSELLAPNGYYTSSRVINNIILNEVVNIFIIRKIKMFTSAEEVLIYENRFLEKVNAKNNDSFYNLSHNSSGIHLTPKNLESIMLSKYGVKHHMQSVNIIKKREMNCLKKYGVKHTLQLEKVKNKSKITSLKKYGTEYPSQSEEVRNKIKSTCLKKYNSKYFVECQEFKEKSKKTCIEKYGTEYYAQSDDFKEKSSKAQIGDKHHLFSGYFITPYGKFGSATEAQNTLKFINRKLVQRYCLFPDKLITRVSYSNNKYLQYKYDSSIIGLTPRDLGFNFISV